MTGDTTQVISGRTFRSAGGGTPTQNTSGESSTEPTAAMLARKRNTSPILRMISAGRRMRMVVREKVDGKADRDLCGRDQFYQSR